jgi:hypothetical protein
VTIGSGLSGELVALQNRSHRFVPCNGCTFCCQGDAIRILPEDDAASYLTEPHPVLRGVVMIAHKPNGDCIYLGERGCTIHDRAPSLCRSADCRTIARRLSFEEARQMHMLGRLDIRVWDRGRELLAK